MKGLFRNRDLMVGTYDHLFTYFSDGFLRFASPGRERVLYPGMGSCFGPAVDGLQGFARTAPLLAAWATSSREPVGTDPVGGQRVDLVALLQEGLLTGTNKALPAYWGNIGDHDQRTVEAADIARVLWLTRAQIWSTLSKPKQDQVANWLLQVNSVVTRESNWLLFPVVVNFVLEALGYACKTAEIEFAIIITISSKNIILRAARILTDKTIELSIITTPGASPTICFGFTSSSRILTGSLLVMC